MSEVCGHTKANRLKTGQKMQLIERSSPICFYDPLGNGISDFIVNDSVVRAAYEKLVLKEETHICPLKV